MKPLRVSDILQEHQLQGPSLAVLRPTLDEYTLLLLQPEGELEIAPTGIKNKAHAGAIASYRLLLEHAAQHQINLVVTPEYSTPWQALVEAIGGGHGPPAGCLWALGCESLTVGELDALAATFHGVALVLSVPLDRTAAATKTFLDPLAYVFRTRHQDGTEVIAILIQFKTHPSIDENHVEIANLALGNDILVFGDVGSTIRLFSFICSDVLASTIPELLKLYDGSLILHVQLNPKPRESAYRDYRKRLFSLTGDRTEVICVNWARGVISWAPGALQADNWNNIGGSAWYLRPDRFDSRDSALAQNHRCGLYYTWQEHAKCNVLFLNYEPGAYHLVATKVWHHFVAAVQSKRTGPRVASLMRWDKATSAWQSAATAQDGFVDLISSWPTTVAPLTAIYAHCPISTERLLALLKGEVLHSPLWYQVNQLKSFGIQEAEHVRRITFTQEPDPDCIEYRESHIQHFASCASIFAGWTAWPPEIQDIAMGYTFVWEAPHPNSSVKSAANTHATLIYAGENPTERRLRDLGDALRSYLLQVGDPAHRIGIFYRADGVLKLWRHPEAARYDKPDTAPQNITDAPQ
jgi:hypothetical protein